MLAPANGTKIESLIAALSSLRVVDGPKGFVADNVQDFAPFGLVVAGGHGGADDDPRVRRTAGPARRQAGSGPGRPRLRPPGRPGRRRHRRRQSPRRDPPDRRRPAKPAGRRHRSGRGDRDPDPNKRSHVCTQERADRLGAHCPPAGESRCHPGPVVPAPDRLASDQRVPRTNQGSSSGAGSASDDDQDLAGVAGPGRVDLRSRQTRARPADRQTRRGGENAPAHSWRQTTSFSRCRTTCSKCCPGIISRFAITRS